MQVNISSVGVESKWQHLPPGMEKPPGSDPRRLG